jgi:hypothetical protein
LPQGVRKGFFYELGTFQKPVGGGLSLAGDSETSKLTVGFARSARSGARLCVDVEERPRFGLGH